MTIDKQRDERISAWLETEAPRQLPDRVLSATFEQTRKTNQLRSWRRLLRWFPLNGSIQALSTAAVVLVVVGVTAAAFALGSNKGFSSPGGPSPSPTIAPTVSPTEIPTQAPTPSPSPEPISDATRAFLGDWVSISDEDGGTQSMTVSPASDGGVDIVVRDTIASVCDGGPSTMTGSGSVEGNFLVVPTPDYTCDDGSEPHLLNGDPTPLNEFLRNLTYVRNPQRDVLRVGDTDKWRRPSEPAPTPAASISE